MPKAAKRPSVTDRINAAAAAAASAAGRTQPWEGPAGSGPDGGVTQSLLGRYLSDGERFRVQFIEGWNPAEGFEPRLEFGNMWHVCEEEHAAAGAGRLPPDFFGALWAHAEDLCRRFPSDRPEIALWAEKCAALFPIYVEHWADHPDQGARTPLEQEATFDSRYCLPSGRVVRLRGKRDSVDLVGAGRDRAVWLQENKTKSGINSAALTRQLTFDLQSMLYLVALGADRAAGRLKDARGLPVKAPVAGVRYNVVRRPAHKSVESMLEKVRVDRKMGRAGEWFARWNVTVSGADLARFRRECLDPVLENLYDDWEWWDACFRTRGDPFDAGRRAGEFPHHVRRHFRFPYGVYNPLIEGGSGEVDEYLNSGSTAGLRRKAHLFDELAPARPSP